MDGRPPLREEERIVEDVSEQSDGTFTIPYSTSESTTCPDFSVAAVSGLLWRLVQGLNGCGGEVEDAFPQRTREG